jgi:23S rRNA pseudouridine2605 synthase/16S rRNA pseudouridine516 synthase
VARRPKTPRWLAAARTRNAPSAAEKPDWLSRALARAGALPLKEAEEAIAAGKVKLEGKTVREPFTPVLATSRISLEGRPVDIQPRTRVLMFHKPAGVVTSDHDPQKVGTVFERLGQVLPPELVGFGWHAVGRLDRDTTGLLLFTNDERFVAHATSPETKLPKRYLARVSGQVTEPKLERLRKGLRLDEEEAPTRPAMARLLPDARVELTLTEGRHHQVKRMLGAVGLPVLALHREAIGTLQVDVPESQCRLLSDDEVRTLLGYEPRNG